jgi:hypothetical protein
MPHRLASHKSCCVERPGGDGSRGGGSEHATPDALTRTEASAEKLVNRARSKRYASHVLAFVATPECGKNRRMLPAIDTFFRVRMASIRRVTIAQMNAVTCLCNLQVALAEDPAKRPTPASGRIGSWQGPCETGRSVSAMVYGRFAPPQLENQRTTKFQDSRISSHHPELANAHAR